MKWPLQVTRSQYGGRVTDYKHLAVALSVRDQSVRVPMGLCHINVQFIHKNVLSTLLIEMEK